MSTKRTKRSTARKPAAEAIVKVSSGFSASTPVPFSEYELAKPVPRVMVFPSFFKKLGFKPVTSAEKKKPGWFERRRSALIAAEREYRAKHHAAERARLDAIEDAKPRCPLCPTKVTVKGAFCAPCEERRKQMYQMGAGGVYPMLGWKSNVNEGKPGKVVKVDKKVAARVRYIGQMRLIEGRVCALFQDPKGGAVYAQPVG